MAKRKVRYVYAMKRPGYGYEPGAVVSEEFAAGHPWAVREEPDENPPEAPAPADTEDGE